MNSAPQLPGTKANDSFGLLKCLIQAIGVSFLRACSTRVLSKELKELELNHIIARKVDANLVTKVDYEVLTYCKSFDHIIKLMIEWGKQHRKVIAGK